MLTVSQSPIHKTLGFHRSRLLACLGVDLSESPVFHESDPFTLYRDFVEDLTLRWTAATDRATISLLAAARVLYGDLGAALIVIDHFPQRPIRTDRDAGICLLSPFYALATALPLPEALRDTSAWLAGSPQQTVLRSWIEEHAGRLRWNEPSGFYEFR